MKNGNKGKRKEKIGKGNRKKKKKEEESAEEEGEE